MLSTVFFTDLIARFGPIIGGLFTSLMTWEWASATICIDTYSGLTL